jgi:hypothetical protein
MKGIIWCAILTGCVVGSADAPPEDDEGADIGDGTITPDAAGIAGCSETTTVIIYSEETNVLTLPTAFAGAVDPCTRYYVDLPPLSSDKTMPRPSADKVHALGPNFYAMAEFSWGSWKQWIDLSPGTRDWQTAGHEFRTRMAAAGYDVAHGDVWSVNEFPSTTRTGEQDVWTHERSAVKALALGDGSLTVKGVVYTAGMPQTLADPSTLKSNMKNWLQQDAWWADMNSYVRWYAYEVYGDPHTDCVIGSNVLDDADHVSAYLEHLPRLAHAGGAASATASAYLQHHYVPLVNAAFGADVGFGNNVIGFDDFVKFSRLQIYATHVNAAHVGYPGRRIGFAWAPKNTTADQETYLSGQIANSVGRAYPANKFYNYGKYSCNASGALDGCGCTVSGAYNNAWDAFSSW